MEEKKPNLPILKNVAHALSLLSYIGFLFIGNILFYLFIYKVIEKHFFRSTVLLVIFFILGIISGFYAVHKAIDKIKKDK